MQKIGGEHQHCQTYPNQITNMSGIYDFTGQSQKGYSLEWKEGGIQEETLPYAAW